jgi:hypothetical protein
MYLKGKFMSNPIYVEVYEHARKALSKRWWWNKTTKAELLKVDIEVSQLLSGLGKDTFEYHVFLDLFHQIELKLGIKH